MPPIDRPSSPMKLPDSLEHDSPKQLAEQSVGFSDERPLARPEPAPSDESGNTSSSAKDSQDPSRMPYKQELEKREKPPKEGEEDLDLLDFASPEEKQPKPVGGSLAM